MNGKIQYPKTFLFLLSFFCLSGMGGVYGQEFNCTVSVNDRQISGSSHDYVSDLRTDLERYINTYRWTNDRYEEHERIRCNIQIVLTGVDSGFNYSAEAVFTMRRPIYNTIQQSTSIVLNDNSWRFHYPQNKNLIHDDHQFDDLTSFIDFYIYVMLGYDYDSFSELAGSSWFNRAQTILELGQGSGEPGWSRAMGAQRNRFGLIQDMTNPGYEGVREAFYRYHRLGLDQFTINPDLARDEVIGALELLRDNKQITSNTYLFDLFFGTKYTEIVAMLNEADNATRLEAYNILRDVDPGHTSEYDKLRN